MMKKIFFFAMFINLISLDSILAVDCVEVGKKVAVQQGGTLTRSTPSVQNDKNMCVVVIVIPAHNGNKLRRVEVVAAAD
ncbi:MULTISPECIES: hypothetical protein [unclassified Bartonella]|uniref:hypothetical protein n=1 Tax=unclassified Bartonella TaxID=2645622 RepID=UPI000999734B|nr:MULTISPECIES: hypothetical protein [unclassified Bartonella]AQX27656.1 hypothetical protein BJB15x_002430 [Bartonella sp. JB15]AQX28937.1 hypothetical protein BJB63x_002420 [Bartonella sp. JB63]